MYILSNNQQEIAGYFNQNNPQPETPKLDVLTKEGKKSNFPLVFLHFSHQGDSPLAFSLWQIFFWKCLQ
jgi:hypothetical protein